jgi:hypothetical protein
VPAGNVKVTTPVTELTVHPEVSTPMLKVTGFPDGPPVAVTVYVVPGSGLVGGVLVKRIVWVPSADVTVCCCTVAAA